MLSYIELHDMEGLLFYIVIRAGIILLCWTFVIISNIIDFFAGTATARALGEPLMSHGFRRTIVKMGSYFRVMTFALMFDILGGIFPFYKVPFASMLCAIAVMYIEGKSVVENGHRRKAHAADVPEVVKQIVRAATTKDGQKILDEITNLVRSESEHPNKPELPPENEENANLNEYENDNP